MYFSHKNLLIISIKISMLIAELEISAFYNEYSLQTCMPNQSLTTTILVCNTNNIRNPSPRKKNLTKSNISIFTLYLFWSVQEWNRLGHLFLSIQASLEDSWAWLRVIIWPSCWPVGITGCGTECWCWEFWNDMFSMPELAFGLWL